MALADAAAQVAQDGDADLELGLAVDGAAHVLVELRDRVLREGGECVSVRHHP